jgi:hypothetical protein
MDLAIRSVARSVTCVKSVDRRGQALRPGMRPRNKT